ncbi:phage tail protein [Proteus vulgaris]|uniref:phage tail protein n=1 Tax=Proteus vulgaris TaxID=585 RepID=UPI003458D214
MESNQATWDQGFGQITMLPVSAGGLPPKGQDFNGILNQMCETIVHISKGGVFKFSADYATAINGYPKGAILQSEDEEKYYQSIIDNNKVNFNTASQDQIKTSWKLVMTDDLLDQLSKKLESSAVVQSTGTSTTSVMSQKASTDSFQPKGNYQPAGNYALLSGASFTGPVYAEGEIGAYKGIKRVHLKAEDDGCSLAINDGNGYRSVQIPAKNGTMAFVGDSYTKTDSDRLFQPMGNYQPAGNYALKSGDSFTGAVYAAGEIGVYNGKNRTHLKPTESGCSLLTTIGSEYKEISIPHKSGTMVLMGDVYNRGESDLRFQPKGNYQPAGNYALLSGASFTGPVYAEGEIGAYNGGNRVHILAKNNKAYLAITKNAAEYFIIDFPNDNGTVALLSDIDKSNNIPVGSPIPWSLPTAPSGYLICQGQTFNKTTYPKLAIAYPSGRLPELRSEFIRGADAGRGIDTGREVLSSQSGNSLLSARGMGGNSEFSLKMSAGSVGTDNQGQREIYQQIEGQNGNETRPRNIAFLYIVRAA